ncbi:hypothetical protein [Pseudomonas sp. NFX1]|uniref:hypothetical protein n=1 Tax=Pseudomonas sp. NFX1 TaxID=2201355 RepID=UPI003DA75346
MSGAAQKTEISELHDAIIVFGDDQKRAGRLDEIGWARLFNKVRKLGEKSEFSAASLLLQATMHGIKGDAAQAEKIFDIYSANHGKTTAWHIIRASMSRIIGTTTPITDMLESGLPYGNLNNLTSTLSSCTDAGFYSTAYKILLEINKLSSSVTQKILESQPYIIPAAIYINEHNLEETRISERVLTLTKLVNESSYMLRSSRVLVNEFGITYEVIIDDKIEALADFNLMLYEELARKFDFPYAQHVSVGVSPMENRHDSK